MEEITLKLTIDEANLILESLGEMPFKRVYPLISKIQRQASAQLGSNGKLPEGMQVEGSEMEKPQGDE